jgi:hypothetical protein
VRFLDAASTLPPMMEDLTEKPNVILMLDTCPHHIADDFDGPCAMQLI